MKLSMKILLGGGLMLGGAFWVYLGYLFCLCVGAKHHQGFEAVLIWLALIGSGAVVTGMITTTILDKKEQRETVMEGKPDIRDSVAQEIYGTSYSSLCWRRRDRVDELVRERQSRSQEK